MEQCAFDSHFLLRSFSRKGPTGAAWQIQCTCQALTARVDVCSR